eukprot:9385500-Lingulodinium_polyedra.AAC.1
MWSTHIACAACGCKRRSRGPAPLSSSTNVYSKQLDAILQRHHGLAVIGQDTVDLGRDDVAWLWASYQGLQ